MSKKSDLKIARQLFLEKCDEFEGDTGKCRESSKALLEKLTAVGVSAKAVAGYCYDQCWDPTAYAHIWVDVHGKIFDVASNVFHKRYQYEPEDPGFCKQSISFPKGCNDGDYVSTEFDIDKANAFVKRLNNKIRKQKLQKK